MAGGGRTKKYIGSIYSPSRVSVQPEQLAVWPLPLPPLQAATRAGHGVGHEGAMRQPQHELELGQRPWGSSYAGSGPPVPVARGAMTTAKEGSAPVASQTTSTATAAPSSRQNSLKRKAVPALQPLASKREYRLHLRDHLHRSYRSYRQPAPPSTETTGPGACTTVPCRTARAPAVARRRDRLRPRTGGIGLGGLCGRNVRVGCWCWCWCWCWRELGRRYGRPESGPERYRPDDGDRPRRDTGSNGYGIATRHRRSVSILAVPTQCARPSRLRGTSSHAPV